MSMFNDINLEWQGKSYAIPAQRGLEAMARVEEAMTLHELQIFYSRRTLPLAKLVQAYASLLCCAGRLVTAEEVYAHLKATGAQEAELIAYIAQVLLAVLLPSGVQKQVAQGNHGQVLAVGETATVSGNFPAAPMMAWSKPGSSSWSDPDGSHPKHSGPGRRWKSSGSSKRKRRSR